MTDQEMVDRFALIARPRLVELLRLKAEHVYDNTPGAANSTSFAGATEVRLKLTRTVQPYAQIERFANEEKEMGFVVNPGLVPIVKAITLDVRGRKFLVTRKVAATPSDQGMIAHVDGYGVRILLHTDADNNETRLTWECLYGVA
jgi:hypothetical protein